MEQAWILAAVLVPALAWPACNGGTENLGEDGDGGSAGEQLEGDANGTTGNDKPVTAGPVTVVVGAGGAGSGGMTAMGAGGAGGTGSGGMTATGMGGMGGAGGFGVDGTLPDSVGFASNTVYGAGGAYGGVGGAGGVGTTNAGPVGAGGAGGTNQTYAGANALYDSSTQVVTLISDADQLYTGGSRIAAIPLPNGPANVLGNGNTDLRLAVDDTDLYVCSTGGSLYRMSKNGGGTQNFQGAEVNEGECRAVSVNDTTVHAVWLDAPYSRMVIRSWAKSDRTAPQDGSVIEDVSQNYRPYLIANDAVYYADRRDDELLLGRVLLDDYSDEALLSVDAEFDSEYLVPLAAQGDALYFQGCEQTDRWCSLFVQNGADEPIPYEQFQRDSVIKSLALVGETAMVALPEGIHALETTEGELKPIWIHPSMVNYGPLLALGNALYFVSNPVYSASMVWHLPL